MFDRVFVTVGTTSFESLINLILTPEATDLFKKWEVKEVRIQAGTYTIEKEPATWTEDGISFELYDYKPSITEDMRWADLIISHAGAGTTIEALDLKKVLLVVPNEDLLDNHQVDLARKLKEESYAFMATLDDFFEEAEDIDPDKVRPFPQPQPQLFNKLLLKIMKIPDEKDVSGPTAPEMPAAEGGTVES